MTWTRLRSGLKWLKNVGSIRNLHWKLCVSFGSRSVVGAATGLKVAGSCGGCWGKGGDQLPGKRPLRDGARDKCSHRPLFRGIISTLLICSSIHIHTRLPWMEREKEAEIGGNGGGRGARRRDGRGGGEGTVEIGSQTSRQFGEKETGAS